MMNRDRYNDLLNREAVLATVSVRSSQKVALFIIKNTYLLDQRIFKIVELNFENSFTAAE